MGLPQQLPGELFSFPHAAHLYNVIENSPLKETVSELYLAEEFLWGHGDFVRVWNERQFLLSDFRVEDSASLVKSLVLVDMEDVKKCG